MQANRNKVIGESFRRACGRPPALAPGRAPPPDARACALVTAPPQAPAPAPPPGARVCASPVRPAPPPRALVGAFPVRRALVPAPPPVARASCGASPRPARAPAQARGLGTCRAAAFVVARSLPAAPRRADAPSIQAVFWIGPFIRDGGSKLCQRDRGHRNANDISDFRVLWSILDRATNYFSRTFTSIVGMSLP
jgi:hypothetical protein